MNVLSILAIALSPVLSTITTFAVLFITKKIDRKAEQRQVDMIRIEKLYSVFYQKCLTIFYPQDDTFLTELEIAGNFLDIFTQNIIYMSNASQKLYTEYYKAFLNYHLHEENETPDISELNIAFKKIGKSLQQDYISLCKKLRLEKPIELFE